MKLTDEEKLNKKNIYLKKCEEEWERRNAHKISLAKENGVLDNPKLDKLYEIAWSLGHSYGFNEVEQYFNEMVDLIK